MFAVIQFPIADTRYLATEEFRRLKVPTFPDPVTYGHPEFVRCFGPAVDRRLGADPGWTDERAYCKADKAIRFVDFLHQRLGPSPLQFLPSCVFRRLFSDGRVVTRVEIAIGQPDRAAPVSGIGGAQCLGVARDFMNLPTTVASFRDRSAGDQSKVRYGPIDKLVRQGRRLARLYSHATAAQSTEWALTAQEDLVADGRPLVIIEFEPWETEHLPEKARIVEPNRVGGATLAFKWLDSGAGLIGTWFIRRRNGRGVDDDLRRLRLCLLRLHAEREVFDLVISQLHYDRITFVPQTEAGERLEAYLNHATNVVERPERFGISQSAILEAFDAAESVERPDERQALVDRYTGVRKQVWLKVEAYEKRRAESRVVPTTNIIQGDYVKEKHEVRTGSTYNIRAKKSQIGGIGDNATGTVSGILNAGGTKDVDAQALDAALTDLYACLAKANLNSRVLIEAHRAAGAALTDGVKDGKVNAEPVVTQVKLVGDTLKQANVAVQEGTSLWVSVTKLAAILAPIVVGGARVIGAWFGVPI